MRILITGSKGFVGSSLKEGLSGYLFCPTHDKLDLLDGEAVSNYVVKHKIDKIVHCATSSALSHERNINIRNDLRMFYNLATTGLPMIYFGSGAEVYYDDDYALSKIFMNSFTKGTKILNLRLFGIFGENENYLYKFITNTIAKHVAGLPIIIKQDRVMDYLDIKDLVKIVKYFLENETKENDYDVVPTKSISLREIAGMLGGYKVLHHGWQESYVGHNAKLLRDMPSLKFTPIEESIKRILKIYKNKELDISALKEDNYLKGTHASK